MDNAQYVIPPFKDRIRDGATGALTSGDVSILQVNVGYRCNMACRHCHVEAGPGRYEMMDIETVGAVLDATRTSGIGTLDITGGAPEMNPNFRHLVSEAAKTGCNVIVRTNLTIFFEEGMEYLPEFMSDHSVELIASLPHYAENNVERVRGKGTFERCVMALQRLNSLGYGTASGDKRLNLVYNPPGAFLPPDQEELEEDYRNELHSRFGISFDALYVFANMPIGRFRDYLLRTTGIENYMRELACAFNPETIPGLMCRRLINVGWDGSIYDCDFNQLLGLAVKGDCRNITEFDLTGLRGRAINVGDHCYACTAGRGST